MSVPLSSPVNDDQEDDELLESVRGHHAAASFGRRRQAEAYEKLGRNSHRDHRQFTSTNRVKLPLSAFAAVFFSALLILLGVNLTDERAYVDLRMLRGILLPLLLVFLIIVNMYVWQRFDIDYIRILSVNDPALSWPRLRPAVADNPAAHGSDNWALKPPASVGRLVSLLSVLWVIAVGIVVYTRELMAPDSVAWYACLLLWLIVLAILCCPFRILFRRSRLWLCYSLLRVMTAPFHRVHFVDSWIADQLTSLALMLLDFEYTVCLMVKDVWLGGYLDRNDVCLSPTLGIRQVLQLLPSWFRFFQCLRAYRDTRQTTNLLNAGKYFSSLPVVVAASLVAKAQQQDKQYHSLGIFYIWLCLGLVHAIYVFAWDVIMDWGLFRAQNVHPGLRPVLLYGPRRLYYGAIVADLFLRFAWTMKMSLSVSVWFGSDMLLLVLAVGEVFRRFMWNFIRLEHEQVKHLEALDMSLPNAELSQSFSSAVTAGSCQSGSESAEGGERADDLESSVSSLDRQL